MGIAVILSLVGCITFLFRQLIVSKNEQIKLIQEQLKTADTDKRAAIEGWIRSLNTGATVARAATKAVDIAERRGGDS